MPNATPDDACLWSTSRQAAAIRSGELGCRALLEAVISRIERLDGRINAVITRDFAAARAAADAADVALARGDAVGPLHGVPITIKDALETTGLRSTGGATELRDNLPAHDAPVVRAVKAVGAIIIGKTNLPRWSGDVQSFNEMFGTTVNPWDATRVPGGSSGGAAAAVATGMTSFEIGTDIGGSIRIPSAFCGVFGHKPSFGIVPSTGYLDHMHGGHTEADINVLGPIARSAEDLELLLGLLLRRDGALVPQLQAAPANVRSLRVAAWLDDPFCPVDSACLAVLNAATDALAASGVTVDRDARPDIDPAQASGIGMWLVTSAMLQSAPEELARVGGTTGTTTHRAWLDAHRAREGIRARWAAFFEHYDAVLMPVAFVPPFLHAQAGDFGSRTLQSDGRTRPYADLVRWTILTGMAYLPATVPPIGRTAGNLPVGMQVVGPWGGDWRTIRLAAHISALCGGYVPPPDA